MDGDKINDPLEPLPYYLLSFKGMFAIRSIHSRLPNALKGTFTDETSAKKTIVRYFLSKNRPPKRKKFKYKTSGRPVVFKRTSKWQKQNK